MSDITKHLDSDWLKAKINVQSGDHIRFEDEGVDGKNQQGADRLELTVSVLRNGEALHEKKFSPNKTNLKEIVKLYGTESEKWIGKEMRVEVEPVRNPTTGEKTNGIALYPPGENRQ